jgi:hypothetical protein
MTKKNRITVRITESQLRRLTDHLIEENKTKSMFFRDVLDEKLNRFVVNKGTNKKVQNNNTKI